MAGGGVGTSTAPKAAATIPSGSPLDGSPKFEAATAVNMDSAPVTTGAGTPTAGTLPATGTNLNGLPPWLSMFFGPSFGGAPSPATPSTGGSHGYKPFVPGTSLTGYAGARPPAVYAPPPKPTTTPNAAPVTPGGAVPDVWYPGESWLKIDPKTGTWSTPSKDQLRMQQWLDYNNQNMAADRGYQPGGQ